MFAGQFDLDAAEAICGGDVLDVLTRLTQRSMLAVRRPATGGTRYELLESLREYGRERLDDRPAHRAVRARTPASSPPSPARSRRTSAARTSRDAIRRADASFADLRAAQRFALDVGDLTTGFGLICSLREYAMRTMRYEVFAWADAHAGLGEAPTTRCSPTLTGMRAYGAWVRGEFDVGRVARRVPPVQLERRPGLPPTGLVERVLANVLCTVGEVDGGRGGDAPTGRDRRGIGRRLAAGARVLHVLRRLSSVGDCDEANA